VLATWDSAAETYWYLAHQDRSGWSDEVNVRPFKEKWQGNGHPPRPWPAFERLVPARVRPP